mmetsp:Transcript_3930/g.5170  ORF Transcript_3930/g.5170 Transcript_3930/m.5170 type:complete len:552 (-) Transcript_3930:200-1855(-)|eukprot:CAMPEP_0198144008 /NCGR_PEP_ID=MMETSP1443-20131203/12356_1 /TAXON_ID=186043 /ORGANISM="Entomoneis sp., Strain CCMP2396" /LENGTH=551 /DNA_ID=CAMNT_0043807327 /DNA_START=52 /DNA_END=1707 /DNA_ORIENTATION=-
MSEAALQAAVQAMNNGELFDVIIVCTTDDHQASYWMNRLSNGVCARKKSGGSIANDSPYPMVLAVSEDWNSGSGAGNGLGTLYAFQKAAKLAQELHGKEGTAAVDLMSALQKGEISAALYHTAGKGTRLAPLPAGENNNKPGVKLPFGLRDKDGNMQSLTVLEAVVKQTGIYASSRKGRLSVFWGDQVFLPSAPFQYKSTHHADILCTLLGDTAPTAEEWTAQGLDKYGVIACLETDVPGRLDAAQVEKVSHETATEMLGKLGKLRQVGPSLGSFSVSSVMLKSLTHEFATELAEKTAKFDTDPHFWMPMTLSESDYISLMEQKGTDAGVSKAHYDRMAKMKASFDLGDYGLFGAVNVGKDAKWWDYGLVKLYSKNSLLLLEESPSADLLRQFLGVDSHLVDCDMGDGVSVDGITYAFDSKAKSGSITKSVVSGIRAGEVNLDGAIVINCTAKKITAGPGAILYNIVDESEEGIVAHDGEIKVAVTEEDGTSMILQSKIDIDGGKAWKQVLEGLNTMSFEDVHTKNKMANIGAIQTKRQELFNKAAASLGF